MPTDPTPADTVLVAENDPVKRSELAAMLTENGYAVLEAADGARAIALFHEHQPDLVLVNTHLPRSDGLTLLKAIRRRHDTPVILRSSRDDEVDRVVGLELGADDYIVEPCSLRELLARVRARLRGRPRGPSQEPAPTGTVTCGETEIDLPAREVRVHGVLADLTTREYDLFTWLARHPRETFTRSQLLDAVWGTRYTDPATVTEHVRRIRSKLTALGAPDRMITLRGVGYRFDP